MLVIFVLRSSALLPTIQGRRQEFLYGCQAYDVDLVAGLSSTDDGSLLPLDEAGVRYIRSASPKSITLQETGATRDRSRRRPTQR